MSGVNKKDWERPWSTEEIVEHADNWNLACDAALLNTLKAFGDKIVNKSEEVYKKLDDLCDNLEQTNLRFDLARNEFNSLRNSQFMEFRVYEDDETLPTEDKQEEKAENNVPKEETMEDLRKAVALGLDILDEFYEKVEVTVSDSEDDDEAEPSYVYRKKDPYIDRRLPYVIGTDEWYKKWHVGLLESSDSENEKSPSEKFSDSDNEEPFQVKDHSDVSSEFSNISGLNTRKGQPSAVSTANTTINNDFLASTSESDSPGASTPKVSNFAEQLAAKLGNVIKENKNLLEEPEVNRRPIQKKQSDYGALFSDEPPPLDENVIKSETHGIFSGGKGLFDDEDEDDTFWNPGKSNIASTNQQRSNTDKENIPSRGLFEEDSDDDIFSSARKVVTTSQIKQPYLQTNKTTAPIFSEEPPLFENVDEKKVTKKPPGGVSPFGDASIFQSQKIGDILKQRKSSPPEDLNQDTVTEIVKNESNNSSKRKTVENIDSNQTISTVPKQVQYVETRKIEREKHDLFKDSNLKNNRTNQPEKDDLFENIDDDEKSDFLNSNLENRNSKIENLFDDDIFGDSLFKDIDKKYSSNLFSDDIPSSKDEIVRPKTVDEQKGGNLFDNVSEIENEYDYSWRKSSKSKISSLFDNDDDDYDLFKAKKFEDGPKVQVENEISVESSKIPDASEEISKSTKSKLSLFNDDFNDVDDLFSEILKKDRKKSHISTKEEARDDNLFDIKEEKLGISKIVHSSGNSDENSDLRDEYGKTALEKNIEKSVSILDRETSGNENQEVIPKIQLEETDDIRVAQSRSSTSVPHVNFLDSVPPPEDGWDNSSDNAFDDLEPYGNDDFQSEPSSLFDSEPPSLFFNNTSGIVKDYGYNRINSGSSFDPSLSSTRRLSTDIFNDEQYNDSIFLTKNQDSNTTPNRAGILSVPEVSDLHSLDKNTTPRQASILSVLDVPDLYSLDNTEITKSDNTTNISSTDTAPGILKMSINQETSENQKINLKIEDSSEKYEVSENNQKKIADTTKAVSFLDDILGEDETDDLVTKRRAQDVGAFKISENIIADKNDGDGKFLDKNLDRDEKKTSEEGATLDQGDEMQNNISKIAEKFQQMSKNDVETPKNIAIPGKLTHKLQINVGALLPGGAPPRRNREHSHEEPQNENSLSKSLPASRFRSDDIKEPHTTYLRKPAYISRTVSESDASKNVPKLEKSVSFDDATDVEILQSITKGRPKIQVKRKPSSRRARQESLRKSVPDFRLLGDEIANEEELITKENSSKDDLEISSEVLSSTDQKQTPPNVPEKVQEVVTQYAPNPTLKTNILEDEDDEVDDLFKSIQKDVKCVNQAKIISTKKKDLFSDDDEFFDSFKNASVKKEDKLEKQSEVQFSRHHLEQTIQTKRDNPEPKSLSTLAPPKTLMKVKKEKDDLFDSSDDSDDFLKATIKKDTKQPTISVIGKLVQNKSKNLFDSSDEDGDFLESLGTKSREEKTSRKPGPLTKSRGSALFGDENDDEDIFSSSGPSNRTKQDIQPSVIDRKAPKSSSLRKLGSIEGEEDPLSALLK